MKKIILTAIAVFIAITAFAGCTIKLPDITLQMAEPTVTSELDIEPELPEINPEPAPKQIQEPTSFPIITDDIQSYDDLVALLGDPDNEINDSLYDSAKILFYNNYNRVFWVEGSEGSYVSDVTFEHEVINKIQLGMSPEEVINRLGDPSSKSDVEELEEGIGEWYQTWTYKELGMDVIMRSNNKNMKDAFASGIVINKDSQIKLASGIGIGSTKNDVMEKYCIGMHPHDEIYDNGIIINSENGSFDFELKDGKIISISISFYPD